jgi:predicted RNase H-like nuclease (RuvC/YqgF family)
MSLQFAFGQITNLEELKSKSQEELLVVIQNLGFQICQLTQLLTIKDQEILKKDEEIKQKNLELETCHIQIKNMDDLISRIVELESERNELLKRVQAQDNHIEILESTVRDHETTIQSQKVTIQQHSDTIQKHSETIETLQAELAPLVTLQHSLSARQIATEANLKAIEHIFPGGTAAPYYFKSVLQLKKFLKGDDESAFAEAFEEWDLKPPGEQEEVQQKLKVFLKNYKNLIQHTNDLKFANNSSAHTINSGTREYFDSLGNMNAVYAIDYCNTMRAALSL